MASITNFPMPQSIIIDETTATDTYAKFIAAPFQSGFGHTIGNALRRVLLSSLEGAAISAVRIDGTAHEFASLPHVVEDVTEIILNLKKVKLNLTAETPKVLEIRKNIAGVVTAGDIITNGFVEILNPEQIICTLDKDTPFHCELEIAKGRGWQPSERNKRNDQPLGTIPIDCLFSPVTYVRYQVSATRVGEETEMDSLTIEINTDGRISPQDALEKAAKILKDHLRPFLGSHANDVDESCIAEKDQELYKKLMKPVDGNLELSVRAQNCLSNAHIVLLGELCRKTEAQMLKYRNFGRRSLEEIKEKLESYGLSLGMPLSKEIDSAILKEADRIKAMNNEIEEGNSL